MAAPPRKKLKSQDTSLNLAPHKSRQSLFAPFRALGFVTNNVPFALQVRATKGSTAPPRIHILTCVGRSWMMWEGGKMGLIFVGPDMPAPINSLAFDGDFVWGTHGCHLVKYHRGKEIMSIANPFDTTLRNTVVFGSQILTLTEDGRHLLVLDGSSGVFESPIAFENGFTATQVLHPATYLNKVLIASAEGAMQLWNIRTKTCIHSFKPEMLGGKTSTFDAPSSITCLVQAPAVDVVGIGFSSGSVCVYDIRADEMLLRVHMEGGSITSISFRADGQPYLATASSTGNIALWDLNAGARILHIVRGAHDGAVVSVQWIPGQPILLSSGDDNSIKQWLFDSPTAPPRLLKYRSGHHLPPHLIRYYGDDGKQILTAARDRSLRCLSVVRDSRSFEVSQGSLAKKATSLSIPLTNLKFPLITSLSFSSTRSKDWEDVLTTHASEPYARTWSIQNKRVGRWTLTVPAEHQSTPPDEKKKKKKREPRGPTFAIASAVTACGNFGLASFSNGSIEMWNMQSGIARKSFFVGPCPAEISHRVPPTKQTARSISGIATDALNKYVIASTGDGTLNFFDFHSTKLGSVLALPSSIVSVTLQRDSGLLAVICDDLSVCIVDVETKRIVREMSGFKGRVLDLTFSPDSRWLVTTSLDSIIRTFDIPTGRLVDAFRTSKVAVSITFSPVGDFLASAHVDSVGVYLWANRAQYGEVSLKTIVDEDQDVADLGLPSLQGAVDDEDLDVEALASLTLNEGSETQDDVYATPAQLDEELVTLTLLPRSNWQTLLNIDTIQARNKPKEAPKPPEKAPFFIPTLPGVEGQRFDLSSNQKPEATKKGKRLDASAITLKSEFVTKMEDEEDQENGDFEAFFTYLRQLSPAALDLELRSLATQGGLQTLHLFTHALTNRLRTHRDFEAVQTLIKVFLKIHGELFVANEELEQALQDLLTVQSKETGGVLELLDSTMGVLAFVRDATI